jgi:hypothetical protein
MSSMQRKLRSFIAANSRPPDANELTDKSESNQKDAGKMRWQGCSVLRRNPTISQTSFFMLLTSSELQISHDVK